MSLSWDEINVLEVNLKYPDVIDAIEERLKENPDDKEAVIRLGFHYWFTIMDNYVLGLNVPWKQYTTRFRELLNTYKDMFINDADFCFSYGLGLDMCFYYFVPDANNVKDLKAYESLGKKLLEKAATLDPFYKKFNKARSKVTQEEIAEHFSNRGCFLRYYNVI